MTVPGDKRPHKTLSKYSLKEWVRFAFDHPVAFQHTLASWKSKEKNQTEEDDWYHRPENLNYCNPRKLVENVTKLFNNPRLLNEFSDDQINQGCYYLAFGTSPSLVDLLYDSKIPLKLRKKFIKSTANFYREVFANRDIPDSSYMWWDWFRHVDLNDKKFRRSEKPKKANTLLETIRKQLKLKNASESIEAKKISDTSFKTLCEILEINSEACQKGALHGMGHLNHPKVKKTISKFLKNRKAVNSSIEAYAKYCRKKNIL